MSKIHSQKDEDKCQTALSFHETGETRRKYMRGTS